MSANCKCPNCGARIKVTLFNAESPRSRKQNTGKGHTFHNVQPAPTGFIRSFFWFMRGNKNNLEPTKTIRVVSEIKQSPTSILIRELNFPHWVNEKTLAELARLYVGMGYSWSRENTVDNTSLTQGKHRQLNKAFLHLRFLEQINSNQYNLTSAGVRFLRHYYTEARGQNHQKYIEYDH